MDSRADAALPEASPSPWPTPVDERSVPYAVFTDPAIFEREQARIFRGPTWHLLALDDEIGQPGDFKSTYIGTTPVVLTRTRDGELKAWINRCAQRGALVCRQPRGNARVHTCVYHQWAYDQAGRLRGVPFRGGLNAQSGMAEDFVLFVPGALRAAWGEDHGGGHQLFTPGIASGDPGSDRVVLWTRLAPDPLNGGGLDERTARIDRKVATDAAMTRTLRRGTTSSSARHGHAVR